jgi:dolichol-phosphate mannosyltransferase
VASPLVLLPTYNEAENLARLVAAVLALPGVDVLVVDDASPDGTGRLADELARSDPRVGVLHRTGPRGYGEALTEGFREALRRGAAHIVTMDCDFSHDPARVPALLEALGDADVAIGSRYVEGGEVRAWSLSRRILSASANAFVRALFRLPARDCTSGFRAYRRAVLEGIPWERLHSPGYSFLVEVLYWADRVPGRRFREVPIHFVDRTAGRSKMGFREIVSGAGNLLRLRWRLGATLTTTRRGP